MTWHYAFVRNTQTGCFDVYEVYNLPCMKDPESGNKNSRTVNPVLSIPSSNREGLLATLKHLEKDIKRGNVYRDTDNLDKALGILS